MELKRVWDSLREKDEELKDAIRVLKKELEELKKSHEELSDCHDAHVANQHKHFIEFEKAGLVARIDSLLDRVKALEANDGWSNEFNWFKEWSSNFHKKHEEEIGELKRILNELGLDYEEFKRQNTSDESRVQRELLDSLQEQIKQLRQCWESVTQDFRQYQKWNSERHRDHYSDIQRLDGIVSIHRQDIANIMARLQKFEEFKDEILERIAHLASHVKASKFEKETENHEYIETQLEEIRKVLEYLENRDKRRAQESYELAKSIADQAERLINLVSELPGIPDDDHPVYDWHKLIVLGSTRLVDFLEDNYRFDFE